MKARPHPHPAAEAGLYGDPSLYDIAYTPGTRQELDMLERVSGRYGRGEQDRAAWLEPACGSGRLLRLAASRGHRVLGFDRSGPMVAYAQARLARRGLGRRARVFRAELTSFAHLLAPRSVGFAFLTINTIRHLDSDQAMLAHLAEIERVLAPGAVYAVGIELLDYAQARPDEEIWCGRRGRCLVTHIANYLPPAGPRRQARREIVFSHLMVERPRGVEHQDHRFSLRTYDESEWRRLLRRSALRSLISLDADGRPLRKRPAVYQIEVLGRA